MRLTPNFRLMEFLSSGDRWAPNEAAIANLYLLANRLQVLRDLWNKPIIISSGFRSPEYNATIDGASKNSYHILGMAADIKVKGMSPQEVQEALKNWSGGMGSYRTFTHVDIRSNIARW